MLHHDTEETRRAENRRGNILVIAFVLGLIALNLFIRAIG